MSKTFEVCRIVSNELVSQRTYRMRLESPEIARLFVPGQFVMIRLPGSHDPLLGRPLAIYDLWTNGAGEFQGIDVIYVVVGKGTQLFSNQKPGELLEVWGPLGNGFTPVAGVEHLVLLCGGVGQTPLLTLARESLGLINYGDRTVVPPKKVTLCYGARSKDYFAGLDDFAALKIDFRLMTDDGSQPEGYPCRHGLVTVPLEEILASEPAEGIEVAACGPRPMLIAAEKLMAQYKVHGQFSLESPMACGMGICYSCVAKIRDDNGNWDYKRTCVEGPVFDSDRIIWDTPEVH